MFSRTALAFSLFVLASSSRGDVRRFDDVTRSYQMTSSQHPKEPPASASACREISFSGRINGSQKYARELGEKLWVRFAPTENNWGWAVSVEAAESTDDYAWPVNPPFHFGNSENLSTGHGDTVEHQLSHEHRIFFVLNRTVYEQAVKLVNDEAMSQDPEGAGRYLAALPTIPTGVLYLKPTKFEVVNEGKSINWMEYSVTVIIPASFRSAPGLNAKERSCPPMHWIP
jgi:hypothetical protein